MNVEAKWDMGEREGGLAPTPHNPLNYLKSGKGGIRLWQISKLLLIQKVFFRCLSQYTVFILLHVCDMHQNVTPLKFLQLKCIIIHTWFFPSTLGLKKWPRHLELGKLMTKQEIQEKFLFWRKEIYNIIISKNYI